jgi:hypothetical protein
MRRGKIGQFGPKVHRQQGISLTGLIFTLAVLGLVVLLGLKIVPTFVEYRAVLGAIKVAKAAGGPPRQMRDAFDKTASVTYIDAIRGKDLTIVAENGETEVSFAYDKKIPLVGPASLLLEYAGSTGGAPAGKAAE